MSKWEPFTFGYHQTVTWGENWDGTRVPVVVDVPSVLMNLSKPDLWAPTVLICGWVSALHDKVHDLAVEAHPLITAAVVGEDLAGRIHVTVYGRRLEVRHGGDLARVAYMRILEHIDQKRVDGVLFGGWSEDRYPTFVDTAAFDIEPRMYAEERDRHYDGMERARRTAATAHLYIAHAVVGRGEIEGQVDIVIYGGEEPRDNRPARHLRDLPTLLCGWADRKIAHDPDLFFRVRWGGWIDPRPKVYNTAKVHVEFDGKKLDAFVDGYYTTRSDLPTGWVNRTVDDIIGDMDRAADRIAYQTWLGRWAQFWADLADQLDWEAEQEAEREEARQDAPVDVWRVLGIPATKDARTIKRAYAAKLRALGGAEKAGPAAMGELVEARDRALDDAAGRRVMRHDDHLVPWPFDERGNWKTKILGDFASFWPAKWAMLFGMAWWQIGRAAENDRWNQQIPIVKLDPI